MKNNNNIKLDHFIYDSNTELFNIFYYEDGYKTTLEHCFSINEFTDFFINTSTYDYFEGLVSEFVDCEYIKGEKVSFLPIFDDLEPENRVSIMIDFIKNYHYNGDIGEFNFELHDDIENYLNQ